MVPMLFFCAPRFAAAHEAASGSRVFLEVAVRAVDAGGKRGGCFIFARQAVVAVRQALVTQQLYLVVNKPAWSALKLKARRRCEQGSSHERTGQHAVCF